ncbi:MAG: sigma 54-interacting transcriptional regulator [Acidobacteriia bacterium]|nr:sigma 54-interacting transcriptional regulator [Terriglobia bacterium]
MMYQPEIERIGEELYFVAASPATRRLRTQAEMLSQTDVPVLITGEAGSGRATVARLIHSLSLRSSFPFMIMDCGAVSGDLLENELFGSEHTGVSGQPESTVGKFEQCARGTILLEDFDAIPTAVQERLLNLLQTRELVRCGGRTRIRVDVRVMASTDCDLEAAVADKIVDQELSHRLSVFHVHVPPLRERREEIPLLLGHFMSRLTRRYGVPAARFSNVLIEACQHHTWPGNLRELENFVKRFLALADEQAALDELRLHPSTEIAERQGLGNGNGSGHSKSDSHAAEEKFSLKLLVKNAKGETERNAIEQALEYTHWNRTAAARLLNISYRGLLYKIDEYRLVPPSEQARLSGTNNLGEDK